MNGQRYHLRSPMVALDLHFGIRYLKSEVNPGMVDSHLFRTGNAEITFQLVFNYWRIIVGECESNNKVTVIGLLHLDTDLSRYLHT